MIDDDEPMAEVKTDENLNNGSPDDETASQKGNNEADDGKELAEGELADLSGDESKADVPETIDLGKRLNFFFLIYRCKGFSVVLQIYFIEIFSFCQLQLIQRVRLTKSPEPEHCIRPVRYSCEIWHRR